MPFMRKLWPKWKKKLNIEDSIPNSGSRDLLSSDQGPMLWFKNTYAEKFGENIGVYC
jgi:hypothetical protein